MLGVLRAREHVRRLIVQHRDFQPGKDAVVLVPPLNPPNRMATDLPEFFEFPAMVLTPGLSAQQYFLMFVTPSEAPHQRPARGRYAPFANKGMQNTRRAHVMSVVQCAFILLLVEVHDNREATQSGNQF